MSAPVTLLDKSPKVLPDYYGIIVLNDNYNFTPKYVDSFKFHGIARTGNIRFIRAHEARSKRYRYVKKEWVNSYQACFISGTPPIYVFSKDFDVNYNMIIEHHFRFHVSTELSRYITSDIQLARPLMHYLELTFLHIGRLRKHGFLEGNTITKEIFYNQVIAVAQAALDLDEN